MSDIGQTFVQLLELLAKLGGELLQPVLAWTLLIVWVAWWLWAVNWKKAWPVLAEGAWAPVVLITILAALVWASLVPDSFTAVGLVVIPNFWAKLLAIWLVVALACFCGWLQRIIGWTPCCV